MINLANLMIYFLLRDECSHNLQGKTTKEATAASLLKFDTQLQIQILLE